MKIKFLLALMLLLPCMTVSAAERKKVEIYVSPKVTTVGTGSFDAPYASLEEARDAVRKIEKSNSDIYVYLLGGEYQLKEPFILDETDSGNESCTITYEAYGDSPVEITGGVVLESNKFVSPSNTEILSDAATSIKVYDLSEIEFDSIESVAGPDKNPIELFAGGERKTLARWPNNGYATLGKITSNKPIGFIGDERSSQWIGESDGYIMGMWQYDWDARFLKVTGIDAGTREIRVADESPFTPVYGARYYAHNILKELDIPGEYYIDRVNRLLYYYPESIDKQVMITSKDFSLIEGDNVSYVNFVGLNFSCSRENAFRFDGYTDGKISDCRIKSTGEQGIYITTGSDVVIENCEIYETGSEGVYVSGGDIMTLTHGNILIDSCIIYDCTKLHDVGSGGIIVNGVGNKITQCTIYNLPKEAINFYGSEHEICSNEIYNVCNNSNDCGAIYRGGTFAERGNKICHNYIHDVYGLNGVGARGVYFDDMLSGNYVENNILSNCYIAIFIHGGRDNVIRNNFIYNSVSSITVDNFAHINNSAYTDHTTGSLFKSIYSIPYSREPYRSRYPQIKNILKESGLEPFNPKNNTITENHIWNSGSLTLADIAKETGLIENNICKQRAIIYKQ